jgi:hypothetical protein
MTVIKRQARERRWGLPLEPPLTDGYGVAVSHDRRKGNDRRQASASLEDLLILFSELPSIDPERKQ